MPALTSKQIVFTARPVGMPTADTFRLEDAQIGEPGPGEIQVKNRWLSVDPYMRGRMNDIPSYIPPFEVGGVLEGGAVGEVVSSNADGFAAGDLVMSMYGWREAWTAAVKPANPLYNIRKIDLMGLPPQAFLGVAGVTGMTAWAGLMRVAELKEGETVFISGAAGSVGSIACQIAKAKNCRVIGSAGGPQKVAYLRSIGCDEVIDYKAVDGARGLTKALSAAAPKGIDVYFENVGGDHLTAAINCMADFGRIAVCGMISAYNAERPEPGPANLAFIISKRLNVKGFIVFDYAKDTQAFIQDMAGWIMSGVVKAEETVVQGVERTPEAFLGLFSGQNLGKMLVKID